MVSWIVWPNSNRVTLQIFLPIRQTSGLLSKLERWESTRSARVQTMSKVGESLLKKRRSPGAKVARSEGCQERKSPGVKVAMREREQLSGRGSLPARVAEVHLRALSHLEVCGEKKCGSMCCHALCRCGYSTWMLQDDRTGFISHQTSLLQEAALQEVQSEAKRSRKRKCTK